MSHGHPSPDSSQRRKPSCRPGSKGVNGSHKVQRIKGVDWTGEQRHAHRLLRQRASPNRHIVEDRETSHTPLSHRPHHPLPLVSRWLAPVWLASLTLFVLAPTITRDRIDHDSSCGSFVLREQSQVLSRNQRGVGTHDTCYPRL